MRRKARGGIRSFRGCLLAAALLVGGSCGRVGEPVARLAPAGSGLILSWPERRQVAVDLDLLAELPVDAAPPRLFVHLLRRDGGIVRTFDRDLEPEWWPGDRIRVPVAIEQSALAEPLPAGRYRLEIGLYDLRFGRYFVERALDGAIVRAVDAGSVVVPDGGTEAGVRFAAGWLEPLLPRDQQVLGARPVAPGAVGELRVGPFRERSRLFATVAIRGLDAGVREIASDDADGAQHLALEASCTGEVVTATGEGEHLLELVLPAGPDGCALRFETDFRRLGSGGEEPGAILRALSWNPERP